MNALSRRIALKLGLTPLALMTIPTWSQEAYPSRAIRLVVPYGSGTGLDVLTRALVLKLSEDLRTSIVVENLAGSNGIVGTHSVARAAADGYTLLATTQSHYTSGMMYTNLPYEPGKFIPVARYGQAQLVVVCSPSLGYNNVQALIVDAKKSPQKYSFASLGSGSSAHMAGALFNSLAGIQMLHVPYKDAAQALTDTVRGEPTINFVALPTAAAQIKAGKLKALAVTGLKRSHSLPDVPTLAESGLVGYELVAWYALLAPEGTPPDAVQKISAAVGRITASADFATNLARMGMDSMADHASEFAAKLQYENVHWQKIVALTQAKVD